jgi:hypothetical protein
MVKKYRSYIGSDSKLCYLNVKSKNQNSNNSTYLNILICIMTKFNWVLFFFWFICQILVFLVPSPVYVIIIQVIAITIVSFIR